MARRIIIFSTKGGVGKTLLATNIAVSLARDFSWRVCLIDLDVLAVGDIARMLDLKPQKSMADLIYHLKTSPENIKKDDYLTKSSPLGIDFLAGVSNPQQAPHLDAFKIKDVFNLLDKYYDYIIVDAGKGFSETCVAVLNQANLILLVVTPDILSIYQTKWVMDTLQFLHFPISMVKVILNRSESASSINWREVKGSLPIDIIAHIPSEGKVVGQAVNRGIPVVIDNPRTKVSLSIKNFVRELTRNDKLFMARQEIDELRLKEAGLVDKSGKFWQLLGMTSPLSELMPSQEEVDETLLLKRKIHSRLIEELNIKRLDLAVFTDAEKAKELKEKAEVIVSNLLAEESGSFISSSEVRKKLIKDILDEALGLGPLEDLIADPEINDIMVNNKDEIYVERNGKIELTKKRFITNEQVKTIIERIIAPIGRHIDESVPMVDARLPDGSRVNAIIPPLSLTGPTLTIRKFKKERFTVEEAVRLNTLNQQMGEFLKACVLSRQNIIISGATGSGKTTMLNVLSSFIPENERIVTIEDAAELKLSQEHWVRLESRPSNIEGKGAITMRELFRNTLRMRPDRIIIGECRGNETLDMLQAMNTGHDGSMTTLHANSTQDVLMRMDSLILMAGVDLPLRSIREMIASAVDMIIHTSRLSDGSRKIIQITELCGMKDETHVDLRDIFLFKQKGIDSQGKVLGDFQATGYVPSFIEEIKVRNIPLNQDIFKAS